MIDLEMFKNAMKNGTLNDVHWTVSADAGVAGIAPSASIKAAADGRKAEIIVMKMLKRWGFTIIHDWNAEGQHHRGCDLVAEKNGKTWRIEIKSNAGISRGRVMNTWFLETETASGRSSHTIVDLKEIDMLIVYNAWTETAHVFSPHQLSKALEGCPLRHANGCPGRLVSWTDKSAGFIKEIK